MVSCMYVLTPSSSNHPRVIIDHIPSSIGKRISTLSSNKEVFNEASHTYNEALRRSGYKENMTYEECHINEEEPRRKRKNRKGNIIWFNPPFSKSVKTNIGAHS